MSSIEPVAPFPSRHLPLGEQLRLNGLIDEQGLHDALAYRKRHGGKLGHALIALGLAGEDVIAEALRRQGKIHAIHLTPGVVDIAIAQLLGEEQSRRLHAVAINRIAGITTVAMEDPANVLVVDEIALHVRTPVLAVHAEAARIATCIDIAFKRAEEDPRDALDDIVVGAELPSNQVSLDVSSGDEDDPGGLDQPVISLLRGVLEEAFTAHASDIHLEPRRDTFVVRFRVDGVLYQRLAPPKSWSRPCVARLKVLANLDIAQRRLPQDGRAQIEIRGQRVDLRIATTPCLFGEGAVIRILDGGRELRDLESLDLDPKQQAHIQAMIACSEGFVLATGPTGSGKTTTLYALLKRLNTPDTKIITLEDPVENQLEGATQISANPKIGLDFARGLRSILRQDPDVVLVGEIRDAETAQIAVQAALTGHLVLSTVHTVGAAESITRLADMGIEPYLIADTLRGIISQRLVRKICENCRRPMTPTPFVLERLAIDASEREQFYAGVGCDRCHGTGYLGRLGLYEVMYMPAELCELVREKRSTRELREAAVGMGLVTLRDDGVRKARTGQTTLSEVLSVTPRT